ncbi:MAG: nuclear transport factor 2 family protein [Geminicoccaceae bacterium]
MRRLASALLAASLLGSLPARADDAAAIRQALLDWTDAFNAGRADRVCALFAPDLRFRFQGTPERGYPEMCAQLQRALADRDHRLAYRPDIEEIIVSGDLAAVRLVWTSEVRDAAGKLLESTEEPGLDLFRREPDGTWRIFRYLAYSEAK